MNELNPEVTTELKTPAETAELKTAEEQMPKKGRPKGSKNKVQRGRGRKKVARVNPNTQEVTLSNTPREPRRRRSTRDFSKPNYKLRSPEIPGYVTGWFNDDEGSDNIQQKYEEDWDFVTRQEVESFQRVEVGDETVTSRLQLGDKVSQKVGYNPSGSPLYAFFMKKRKEYWESDYQAKQDAGPQKVEDALTKGNTGVAVDYQHGSITVDRDN